MLAIAATPGDGMRTAPASPSAVETPHSYGPGDAAGAPSSEPAGAARACGKRGDAARPRRACTEDRERAGSRSPPRSPPAVELRSGRPQPTSGGIGLDRKSVV